MKIKYDELTLTKEELENTPRSNPYEVVGLFIKLITTYNPKKEDEFYEKLQFLQGDFQPLSALMKQNIKDRMLQNDKYSFIGKSYFLGATPENDYTPSIPYEIEITENDYSNVEEGIKKLFVKSGGADSNRGVMLRLAKDGNYYIWSDSFMGLLTDIRKPESKNPWA
ncbi:MAG: hypothetical protein IKE70_00340 [Bacilli bacterium]|nr:hypothetical protein [Bacilli bacterium]